MDTSALQHLANQNVWGSLWPELSLGTLALLLLVLEIILPKKSHDVISKVAIFGQFILLGLLVFGACSDTLSKTEIFNGLITLTKTTHLFRIFFLLASLLVSMIARVTLAKQTMPKVEFYHIVMVVAAAMMLLVESTHLMMGFVALETVTIGLYVLVSYCRESALTLEAGLKYLIMGALSSSLLLFGIVLLYGISGNPSLVGHTADGMHFQALGAFLQLNPHNFIASVGVILVIAGIAFKMGVFPFQIWVPDVYQGAPTPTTAFLAVASKAAGFGFLLGLFKLVLLPYSWLVIPVLSFMAGATILFGNFAALTQTNVKRLIGLSGVSHAGFLLLGVIASATIPMAIGAVYFYLFSYLLASFLVFFVMAHVAQADDANQELTHFIGLSRDNPFLSAILAIGLGSLAGIPPLAGFMGKFFVFLSAYQAKMYSLLFVAILGVVISIYYYFSWIKAAFFESVELDPATPKRARTEVCMGNRIIFTVIALATLILGFYQGSLGQWLSW